MFICRRYWSFIGFGLVLACKSPDMFPNLELSDSVWLVPGTYEE